MLDAFYTNLGPHHVKRYAVGNGGCLAVAQQNKLPIGAYTCGRGGELCRDAGQRVARGRGKGATCHAVGRRQGDNELSADTHALIGDGGLRLSSMAAQDGRAYMQEFSRHDSSLLAF